MRAFRFKLEGALEWRRVVERRRRLVLTRRQVALRQERRHRQAALEGARRAAQAAMECSGSAFRLWRRQTGALLAAAARRDRRIALLDRAVRDAVEAVLEASADRAALERVRRRRLAQHRAEMGRREQSHHDELGRLGYQSRRAERPSMLEGES